MTTQLSLYDQLEAGAGRSAWRVHATQGRQLFKVDFDTIEVLPGWNARKDFEGIEELAENILQNGLNQPLEGVLTKEGRFLLTDGERRYRAIKLLNERENIVPFEQVEVVPSPTGMKAPDLLVRMLTGGVDKRLYKDVEVADGLLRLKTDFSLSHEEIGKRMGKSRQWVDNMIKLANKPEEVKKQVATGELKKTQVIAKQKDDVKEVAAGLIKPAIQPGLPGSLKTDNTKDGGGHDPVRWEQVAESGKEVQTEVSGKDALGKVNFDKHNNPQEETINNVMKNLNKLESLSKGLNAQAQKDFDDVSGWMRKDLTELKEFYSKLKNKQIK